MDETAALSEQLDQMVPRFLRLIIEKLLRGGPDSDRVTHPQVYLLRQIHANGPCTAAMVGEMMGITSGPVTTMTARLITRGLLKREKDPIDRRVVWFSLTDEGLRVVHRVMEHRQERWAYLMECLGVEKSERLLSLLRDVEDVLEALPED